ncbi:histidine phosphatase family protein [Enemella sp. A6]|uniref:histidine phosphatase family protein n=1 Tax=Enemella sp. A6 TaxID=3440152 RepID=UPI003EBE6FB1
MSPDHSSLGAACRQTVVHLVRHGQSTWNVERRLQGQTVHPPLTDLGRRQAEAAAEELVRIVGADACRLVSSDLVRARETAEIIADRLGVAVRRDEALREQHLGELQGRLTADLVPEPVPEGCHLSEVRWGGGESIADVHARLTEFFTAEVPTAPGHLIVVTHGDTMRVAEAVLRGRGHREVVWDGVPGNGSILTFRG